ncbi:MAG: hypothetical protein ACRYGF_10285 [Janthinobacterium lividum]
MLLLCSALQATHFHGLSARGTHRSHVEQVSIGDSPDTDLNCPLCVSSHSTLPVRSLASLQVQLVQSASLAQRSGRRVPTAVHFAQFTRPPPFPA